MLDGKATTNGALHVAELAERVSVTPATIRYYARSGLLHPQREPDNGYRTFTAEDLHRVTFIRQAQRLGLTISDIKSVLETVDHGEAPCHQVKVLVEQRLASVQGKTTHAVGARGLGALRGARAKSAR